MNLNLYKITMKKTSGINLNVIPTFYLVACQLHSP